MHSIASSPAALRLLSTSVAARVPLAMLSIALLVHAQHLTGSFAAAGIVMAAYAGAIGVGGPLLGRLVDRCGQTAVLAASTSASSGLLVALALLPAGTRIAIPAALAAALGLATPPVAACLRTLLPDVLPDPASVRTAFAIEASASELTWVSGPPLALGVGALWSTGAALLVGSAITLAATAAFALQPSSRRWRPAPLTPARPRGGALQSPAMRTLVLALLGVGVLFGAAEVAITAAAQTLGSTASAAPLLALWGGGSVLGGLAATRLGGGAASARGLALVLLALAAGHLALIPASGSLLAMGAVLVLAGAAIAPTFATIYAMVEPAAPSGTTTEAFAWLSTALAIGEAIGAAGGGPLADHAGAAAVLGLAGGAGVIAVLLVLVRAATLGPHGPRVSLRAAAAQVA
jgi:predicted MFS family arabinose efflux permease